jgi:hypothetical protein
MRKTFKKQRRQSGGSWFRNLFTQKVHPNKTDETDEYIKSVKKGIDYFNHKLTNWDYTNYEDHWNDTIGKELENFKLIDNYIQNVNNNKLYNDLIALKTTIELTKNKYWEVRNKSAEIKLRNEGYYAEMEEKEAKEKEANEKVRLQEEERIKPKKEKFIKLISEIYFNNKNIPYEDLAKNYEHETWVNLGVTTEWIKVNNNYFMIDDKGNVLLWYGLEPRFNLQGGGPEYYFLCKVEELQKPSVEEELKQEEPSGGKSKKCSKKRKKRTNRKRT